MLLAACQPNASDDASAMRRQHAGDAPAATGATEADTRGVAVERVRYATVGGRAVTGTLARPADAEAGRPGVIVVHEWWGLNDNVEAMARRLAAQGYAALAVGLYGGETATTPDQAVGFMRTAMGQEDVLTHNLRQAYRFLTDEVGAPRVGTVGWCFGGGRSGRRSRCRPRSTRPWSTTDAPSPTRPGSGPSRCPSWRSSAVPTRRSPRTP